MAGTGWPGAPQTRLERRQVTETPVVTVTVTEHQLMMERECPSGRLRTKPGPGGGDDSGAVRAAVYGAGRLPVTRAVTVKEAGLRRAGRDARLHAKPAVIAVAAKIAPFASPAVKAIVKALSLRSLSTSSENWTTLTRLSTDAPPP